MSKAKKTVVPKSLQQALVMGFRERNEGSPEVCVSDDLRTIEGTFEFAEGVDWRGRDRDEKILLVPFTAKLVFGRPYLDKSAQKAS